MRGQHERRLESRSRAAQPGVSGEPGARFTGRGAQGEGADVTPQAVLRGEGADASRDSGALGMNPVVHVRHDQIEPVEVGGPEEQIEQRDRIGAPGDGHEHTARRQVEGWQMSAELAEEIHRPES